jgi:hypothetical protein
MATNTNTSKKQEEVAPAPVDPYVATPAPTAPRDPIAAIHWYHVAATAWAPARGSCQRPRAALLLRPARGRRYSAVLKLIDMAAARLEEATVAAEPEAQSPHRMIHGRSLLCDAVPAALERDQTPAAERLAPLPGRAREHRPPGARGWPRRLGARGSPAAAWASTSGGSPGSRPPRPCIGVG